MSKEKKEKPAKSEKKAERKAEPKKAKTAPKFKMAKAGSLLAQLSKANTTEEKQNALAAAAEYEKDYGRLSKGAERARLRLLDLV